jgi:hypothetical protein
MVIEDCTFTSDRIRDNRPAGWQRLEGEVFFRESAK